MVKRLLIVGAVLAWVSVVFAPDVAFACRCAFGVRWSSPADGATDVPTNSEIKVRILGSAPIDFIIEGNDQPVPFMKSIVGELSVTIARLRPLALLQPSTMYVLKTADGEQVAAFTTGDGPMSHLRSR